MGVTEKPGQIYTLMPKVMDGLVVGKDGQTNYGDRYKFRKIDDVYMVLQPALVTHGITVVPTVLEHEQAECKSSKGKAMLHVTLRLRVQFFAPDGSWVASETIGEAMDSGDKAYNKAMSAAMKYAAILTFQLPVEAEKADTENEGHEIKATPKKRAKAKAAPVAGAPVEGITDEIKGVLQVAWPEDREAVQAACRHVWGTDKWSEITQLSTSELQKGLRQLHDYIADPGRTPSDDEIPF